MGDSNEIVESFKERPKTWRGNNNVPPKSVLSGETLSKFIADLQSEIINVVGDFGENSIGENAKLVLYSGIHYTFVQKFCEASYGEYYMISQTAADVLWDTDFRQTVAMVIGESDAKSPITAQVLEGKSYANDTEHGERISQYATESGNYLALDDFISSKVAEAGLAKGNVVYLVGEGLKPDSVGLLTEVPTVLNDANNKGINLSNSVTVGKNLTKNADGTFSFETVDCSDVSVYLDQSGKVIFVDFVETILGNPTEIKEQCSGNGRNKTFECHWIITKIEFPPKWTFDLISKEELKDIICEAFVARTYSRSLTPEKVKSITVDISTSFENSSN